MQKYILYSKKGGWFTKASSLHSDWTKAQIFDPDEAFDICQLHDGNLLPVDFSFQARVAAASKGART